MFDFVGFLCNQRKGLKGVLVRSIVMYHFGAMLNQLWLAQAQVVKRLAWRTFAFGDMLEVIVQTRGRVFPPISKHREVGWENEAQPRFF